ncbi:MAG: M20/M25/M40 family metallo-hydrolase, partial [Litoreibacter sp.]|nr:M20/M25/M40 family metallo-hydrolase [Litoreibacter sp.]
RTKSGDLDVGRKATWGMSDKGGYGWHVHMKGFEVHSSLMHTGVSAILEGAKLLTWINEMNDEIRARTPHPIAAEFDPPFTTIHTGMIQGGTAHNITAKDCIFSIDFRVVPSDDIAEYEARLMEKVAEVEAGMKAIHPDAGIEIEQRFHVPGLKPEEDGLAEQLTRQLTGDNATHMVSFGTEAGQYQREDYSAIICGPGDIAQAHQPNEFISVEQFQKGEAFMDKLVEHLASA